MRVLIATDAWHPQVNGVVRTLTSLAEAREESRRDRSSFLPRRDFRRFRCRPIQACGSRCRHAARSRGASRRRIRTPSTSRPKGRSASWCAPIASAAAGRSPRAIRRAFPEYIAARAPIPEALELRGAAPLPCRRDRHDGVDALADDASCASAASRISACGRAASTPSCSRPHRAIPLDLPRPIFLSAGRVAVEKNLEAFLSLDLPGSKVVIGEGPQEAELRQRFPDAKFLGLRKGGELAGAYGRGRRVRVSEPDRHVRRRAARSARLRRAGRGLSGDGPARRDRRQPGRRARRRPARRLPWRARTSRARPAAPSR